MNIVSNTGPIIGLAKIGKLSLLGELAEEVLIPPMVYRELLAKTGSEAEQIDDALNNFLRIREIKPLDPDTEAVITELDKGEGQAVGLASNFVGDVLLVIDDRTGRKAAEKLNILTTGIIGILLLAKERGLIENVGNLVSELREEGYWLSDEVEKVAKMLAGE